MASRWTQDTLDELAVSHKVHTLKPIEWPQESLGNLFTLQLGKMLNRKARETFPKFPYLGNKDVQWGRFDFSELREMHFDEEERTKFRLIPGDLLVCEGGAIGRTALWTGEFDCYYQKAIHRLRVRTPVRIEARFILHFMRFAATNRLFTDLSSQSSIAHLTREKLALLKVPLPSLPEQRKIAAILSSLDDAIEKTQAVIEQVQVVKRGLMQELLTVVIPGRHTRFKKTEIGEIPADWAVTRIGDLGQQGRPAVKAGPFGSSLKKSFYVSEGYRVYGQEQVLAGDLSIGNYYINEERFRLLKSCEVNAGDILFSLVGTFGETIVVPPDSEPGIINPRLLRLSLDPQLLLPEFFCFWLRSSRTQKLLADAAQVGTMGVLNAGIVKKLALGIPSLPEQSAIVAALTAFDRRLDGESAMKDALVSLKAALMSILLAGELRVLPATEAA